MRSETEKIMKDKKLYNLLQKARKKGSKSSPYVPLAPMSFEEVLK